SRASLVRWARRGFPPRKGWLNSPKVYQISTAIGLWNQCTLPCGTKSKPPTPGGYAVERGGQRAGDASAYADLPERLVASRIRAGCGRMPAITRVGADHADWAMRPDTSADVLRWLRRGLAKSQLAPAARYLSSARSARVFV